MTLLASCNYNDMTGTCAGDIKDGFSFKKYLGLEKGFIVGMDLYIGECKMEKYNLKFFYCDSYDSYDEVKKNINERILDVKEKSIQISTEEFFEFWKRFNLKLFVSFSNNVSDRGFDELNIL